MTFSKTTSHGDGEQITGCQESVGVWVWGGGSCAYKGPAGGRFWGDGTPLCPDNASNYGILNVYENS